MRDGEFAQCGQRLVPARSGRGVIDRGGAAHLAGGVDDGDLDPGTETRIEAHGDARARRRRQQEIAEVRGEYAYGLRFAEGPQPHAQINAEMDMKPGTPCPTRGFDQPAVTRTALIRNREPL